jgi:predicted glycogen debranching enzyme
MEIKSPFSGSQEWLLSNGLGGYSSSTLTGLNSRRYHGLLIAGFSPADRRLMVSKLIERVKLKGEFLLSQDQHWDASPPNSVPLESFSHPARFNYKLPGLRLSKEVFMPRGLNALAISYTSPKKSFGLSADIITTSRDHNWILRCPDWEFESKKKGRLLYLTPSHDDPPTICLRSDAVLKAKKTRYDGLFYQKDAERRYPSVEDLFIGARLESKGDCNLVAAVDKSPELAAEACNTLFENLELMKDEDHVRLDYFYRHFRRRTHLRRSKELEWLVKSSDDFITDKGVIAGYPWFGQWSRDSLISLPGLVMTTGRLEDAESILLSVLESDTPDSHAADSPLWLFWTVGKYLEYGGRTSFVRKIWPKMKTILESYINHARDDGLIELHSDKPLTWMDAIVDSPVTLRPGMPVELEALWFNALMMSAKLARMFGESPTRYLRTAAKAKKTFTGLFWNEGYLYDYIDRDYEDPSIRPNALISMSLQYPILEKILFKTVVDTGMDHLLTPYGLRTLSPQDEKYKGTAIGTQRERDLAYHNGDVWPWLLGPFADAYKRAYVTGINWILKPLVMGHLRQDCICCVGECFDGNAPHTPQGAVHQAWSVAEILRIIYENPKDFIIQ